jgi:hypothetical protein
MRRRPCWSCARPTLLGELVETHLDDGQPGRSGLVAERRPGHLAVPALRRPAAHAYPFPRPQGR